MSAWDRAEDAADIPLWAKVAIVFGGQLVAAGILLLAYELTR